jgi:hypothetical protein
VADSAAERLLQFIEEAIAPGLVVITDGLQSSRGLLAFGYRYDRGFSSPAERPPRRFCHGSKYDRAKCIWRRRDRESGAADGHQRT